MATTNNKGAKVTKKSLVAELKEYPKYADKKESTLMINKKEVLQQMLNECLGIVVEPKIVSVDVTDDEIVPKVKKEKKVSKASLTINSWTKDFDFGDEVIATEKDLLHFGWSSGDSDID